MAATDQIVLASGYAAANQAGIYGLRYDAVGGLTPFGTWSGITNPSFLVVHPNRQWLYAVSETTQAQDGTPGGVWALHFDLGVAPGALAIRALNHRPSGGDSPCHLGLDAAGRWLLVSNYGSGTIGVLPIAADGTLGEMTDLVQHHGSSVVPDRQAGPHAHSAQWTPDGRWVIAADLGIDRLLVYRLDPATGKLQRHGEAAARAGAGPRHVAFHPHSPWVYVSNELDSTVSCFDYDPDAGTLRERQWLSTLPPGVPPNGVADIHLARDCRRLFVSNRGHNSIAVFDVGPDGRLTTLAIPSCGGNWPRNFALAPDGQAVLVANQYSGEVVRLPLQPDVMAIGPATATVAVGGASCVQFVAGAD